MTVLENIALGVDGVTDMQALRSADRARSRNAYGLPLDPDARGARALGRRAPAHRDRALPAAEPEAADHGRADLGADAAGGRAAVRDAAPARGRGRARSSTSATSWTRSGALRPRDDPARRARWSATATRKAETAQQHGAADDRRRARTLPRRAGSERAASRG